MIPDWILRNRSRSVAEVAASFTEVRRATSQHHCACPCCGAEKRHTKQGDRRGAVWIPNSDPTGWKCWQCSAHGDAIDFVSYELHGLRYRELSDASKAEVRGWFELCDPSGPSLPPPRASKRPSGPGVANAFSSYPPRHEVEAFWDACVSVDRDDDALAYLAHRGLLPIEPLLEHEAVRVLPMGATCPDWARLDERPWWQTGHRLIVPLYDWRGDLRSFIARSVEFEPVIKSAGLSGYNRRGLIMAGTYGRQMLASGAGGYMHRDDRFRLSIFEGEINWLRGMARGTDCVVEERFLPVAFRGALGIFSGSFTEDVASRVPDRTNVVIATDDDKQGHEYGAQIQRQLGDRVDYTFAYEPDDSPKRGAA